MSCYFTVVLEDGSACPLPPEMDLKNEGLIFGRNLPTATILLQDIAEELGITPLSAFTRDEDYYEDENEEVGIE